jgi:hypothetical protein
MGSHTQSLCQAWGNLEVLGCSGRASQVMELFADAKESVWQAARQGDMAQQRELFSKINITSVVRPGQTLFQAPLRILRCCLPLEAEVRDRYPIAGTSEYVVCP